MGIDEQDQKTYQQPALNSNNDNISVIAKKSIIPGKTVETTYAITSETVEDAFHNLDFCINEGVVDLAEESITRNALNKDQR